jgi:hypothetical protein
LEEPTVPDEFIPDTKVRAQLGVTEMTTWRWDQHPEKAPEGWPPRIRIRRRNYRNREQFEAFKTSLMQTALAERKSRLAAA